MTSHFARARSAFDGGDIETAFAALNAAMTSPEADNPAVFALLGDALETLGEVPDAAAAYDAALDRAGDAALDLRRRALMLNRAAGRLDRAFLLALELQKQDAGDFGTIAFLVTEFARRGERDLEIHFAERLSESRDAAHLRLAASVIGDDSRNAHNLGLFRRLSEAQADDPYTRFKYLSVAREFLDFEALEDGEAWVAAEVAAGRSTIFEGETPYSNLLHCGDPALNRLATNNRDLTAPPPPEVTLRRRNRPHRWGERLRVGYLTSDLWDDHATMRLFGAVLEAHDRQAFDITIYDYTPDRFVAFDQGGRERWQPIVPIGHLDDRAAADLIRQKGCDILVDLKGHTGGSRSKLLNLGVAPLQVAWLGFPGTTVNVDLDYVIGDAIVLPDGAGVHYHEKICRLPGSYQPNDPVHRPLPPASPRAALGLPDNAFVLAAFNATRKITPATLSLWAEIMAGIDNSILFVMVDHPLARDNLLKALGKRGIAASRVVFAGKCAYPDHLARIRAADLALDTFPYNGHTTTSDMLWAGLPVITKRGSNFASRVSESLLAATGLGTLVAEDGPGMVALARALASDRGRLQAIRHHLETNRTALDLFDHTGFARKLERAFVMMAERARAGLPPADFDVPSTFA